jgi:hypothetical protein
MQIPGHLALALAQANLPPWRSSSKRHLGLIILASLWPDLVDKTIGYVLGAMPNGRHYAHNLFTLAGTTLLVGLLLGWPSAYAWLSGYLGHLLADTDRLVPWFFPWQHYSFTKSQLFFKPVELGQEILLLLLMLLVRRMSQSH